MPNRGHRSIPGNLRSDALDMQQTAIGTFANRPGPRFPGRLYYASDSGILYIDMGSSWVAYQSRMVSSSATTVTFNTSTAENDLMNVSVPAGTITTNDFLRFTAFGDLLSNSGANTHQFRWYWGGTLEFDTGAVATAVSATRKPWFFHVTIGATSPSAQNLGAEFFVGPSVAGAAVGTLDVTLTNRWAPAVNTAVKDTTAAQVIRLTNTQVVSNVADEVKMFGYTIEKMTA